MVALLSSNNCDSVSSSEKVLALHECYLSFVADSPPRCEANLSTSGEFVAEFQNVQFSCSLKLSGDWLPQMTWYQDERQITATVTEVYNETAAETGSLLKSIKTTFLAEAVVKANGNAYICLIQFQPKEVKLTDSATNVPDYLFKWWSPALNIRCKLLINIDQLFITFSYTG